MILCGEEIHFPTENVTESTENTTFNISDKARGESSKTYNCSEGTCRKIKSVSKNILQNKYGTYVNGLTIKSFHQRYAAHISCVTSNSDG